MILLKSNWANQWIYGVCLQNTGKRFLPGSQVTPNSCCTVKPHSIMDDDHTRVASWSLCSQASPSCVLWYLPRPRVDEEGQTAGGVNSPTAICLTSSVLFCSPSKVISTSKWWPCKVVTYILFSIQVTHSSAPSLLWLLLSHEYHQSSQCLKRCLWPFGPSFSLILSQPSIPSVPWTTSACPYRRAFADTYPFA